MQHPGPAHRVPAPANLTHIWDWGVWGVQMVGGIDAREHYLHIRRPLSAMTADDALPGPVTD